MYVEEPMLDSYNLILKTTLHTIEGDKRVRLIKG